MLVVILREYNIIFYINKLLKHSIICGSIISHLVFQHMVAILQAINYHKKLLKA